MDFLSAPIVTALLVFVGIYILFVLIRLVADMFIVAVALFSAVAAYNIQGFYPDYLDGLEKLGILSILGLKFPPEPEAWSVLTIAGMIVLFGTLICLPALPFSATYRQILGVERLTQAEEAKIKGWIEAEMKRPEDEEE